MLNSRSHKKKIVHKEVINNSKLVKIVIPIFVFLVIVVLVLALRFINIGLQVMLWKVSLTRGTNEVNNTSIKYADFQKGLVRISNDGLTYVDKNGKVQYIVSYNMKDPVYEVKGAYFAIAERGNNVFYLFDKYGKIYENRTPYEIQKISLSDVGILSLLMTDGKKSYIYFYDKTGDVIDTNMEFAFEQDGIPLGIAINDNATDIVVPLSELNGDKISYKMYVYELEEEYHGIMEKNIIDNDIVKDKFMARAQFFDKENVFVVYDGGVFFIKCPAFMEPEFVNTITFDDNIKSISYNDNYVAFTFVSDRCEVFNKVGDVVANVKLTHNYDKFYLNNNNIVFVEGKRVMLYDIKGMMIYDKVFDFNVQYISKIAGFLWNDLLVGLIDGVMCLRTK